MCGKVNEESLQKAEAELNKCVGVFLCCALEMGRRHHPCPCTHTHTHRFTLSFTASHASPHQPIIFPTHRCLELDEGNAVALCRLMQCKMQGNDAEAAEAAIERVSGWLYPHCPGREWCFSTPPLRAFSLSFSRIYVCTYVRQAKRAAPRNADVVGAHAEFLLTQVIAHVCVMCVGGCA